MPVTARVQNAYRADEKHNHALLSEEERKKMIKVTLPAPNEPLTLPTKLAAAPRRSRLGVRRFLQHQLHVIIFAALHTIFSLYIRVRQFLNVVSYQITSILYYHHGTPEYIRRDIAKLSKKPTHLSTILKLEESHRVKLDIERLIDETAEMATWCACAEIPMLSVYEKTGTLKKHMPRVYEAVLQKFTFYFGGQHPGLSVTSPHRDAYSSPASDDQQGHLKLHLISCQDGRDSVVDLTRTLADMSQRGKLSPRDISMELVDAELSEGIMPEPDLLIAFTPYINLAGYPPWQIRLTEIFCLQDNESFGYQVFLKGLRRYASAKQRLGK